MKPRTKRRAKMRKPNSIKVQGAVSGFYKYDRRIQWIDICKGKTYVYPYLNAKEARRLANWLLKAADYLEQKEQRK